MSVRRVLILLAAALAVIALAMWLSSQRHLDRATMATDLVLPGLAADLNKVTRLTLRKGDGSHVTLQRGASDWRVDERDWPADSGRVRKLLLDLSTLNVVEEKTHLPANYPQLGVEDVSSPRATGTEITVIAPAHQWSLIAGKAGSGKDGYVRVAGAEASLLATPLITVDADPKSWLLPALLDVPAAQVREVRVQLPGSAAYTVTRDKPHGALSVSPLPRGRVLSGPAAAEPLSGALSALTLDDVQKIAPPDAAPAAAAAGTARHAAAASAAAAAQAQFTTFDGLVVAVSGRKDGTRSWARFTVTSTAAASAAQARELSQRVAGREFAVADYRYDSIFKPLEDLLQKPPQPAKPAPTAGKSHAAAAGPAHQ